MRYVYSGVAYITDSHENFNVSAQQKMRRKLGLFLLGDNLPKNMAPRDRNKVTKVVYIRAAET